MKRTLFLLPLALFFLGFQSMHAQDIKYATGVKGKKDVLFRICIGSEGGNTFVMAADDPFASVDGVGYFSGSVNLLIYTEGNEVPKEVKMKFKHPLSEMYVGFVTQDKKIYVAYKSGMRGSATFYTDVFDDDGAYDRTIDLEPKAADSHAKDEKGSVSITASANNHWFALKHGGNVKLFDSAFDKVWQKAYTKDVEKEIVTNDGTLIMLTNQKENDKSYSIVKVDKKNKWTETKLKNKAEIVYDSINNQVYAVTIASKTNDKIHLTKNRTYIGLAISKTFSYAVYAVADLKTVYEMKDIPFDPKIIDGAVDDANKNKPDGLAALGFLSVVGSPEGKNPIFVFSTRYTHESTSTDMHGNVTAGSADVVENLLLVKITSNGESVQELVTKKNDNADYREDIVEAGIWFLDGKLYVWINTFTDKKLKGMTLTALTFNKDLEQLSSNTFEPNDAHNYALRLDQLCPVGDGSYFFSSRIYFGGLNRNVGYAIVKL